MKKGYGSILKKHRELANVSVKEISDYLIANGIKASESTVYSWENNNSEPKPGAFLLMCAKYGIVDIFKTFGYEPLITEFERNAETSNVLILLYSSDSCVSLNVSQKHLCIQNV